jgi:uroporphyrinogen decarboxylase
MGFTSEVTRSFGEALLEQGVGFSVTEAAASCSLISPKIYRELIFPYEKQIFDHFKERNMTPGLHICGYVDPILEDMVATGATRISIDAPTDLGKLITLTVGKAAVVGNLDTSLFFQGSKEEMELAVKTCLQIAGKKGGYILSTGCDLPAITSPERVKWFMEAARRFGSNENEYNSNGKEGFLC